MELITRGSRRSRSAFGAALLVALLTLAGCSLIGLSPNHRPVDASRAPSPQSTSTYTIEATAAGFVYHDAPSGYAITFPQRPDVAPLAHNETDHAANFASSQQTSSEFASIGQVLNKVPQLRNQLMGWVQSVNPTGQVNASSYTLGGLDAVWAEFTTGDGAAIPSELVGQPGETVMAGDGDNFYQLVAIGGTSDQRQAFFDSFRRTGN